VALTLVEAQQLRADYYAALRALASGQEYTIGTRTLKRADGEFVAAQFEKYDAIVASFDADAPAPGVRSFRVVPRDL